ncbi:MAG: YitT family protein, partial [Clostridia bacterium]|nr:YitT family protein [Clostridia bacterium]
MSFTERVEKVERETMARPSREQSPLNRRNLITGLAVVVSAFVIAFANNVFLQEADLLPGGFMGLAALLQRAGNILDLDVSRALLLTLINIPVALFCVRAISRRFVFFSLANVVLTSVFLKVLPVFPVLDDIILNVIFGGVLYGFGIVIALRGGASSGGTDFIALYVANKSGKELWSAVFVLNVIQLTLFGILFGFDKAGYSILFQFLCTRTISTFHNRYKRITLQIFTKKPDAVVKSYLSEFEHGITVLNGTGGYSG